MPWRKVPAAGERESQVPTFRKPAQPALGRPPPWESCGKEMAPGTQTPPQQSPAPPGNQPRAGPSPATWASVPPSIKGRRGLSDPHPPIQCLRHLSGKAATGVFVSLSTVGHTFCSPKGGLEGSQPHLSPSQPLPTSAPARSHRFPGWGQPDPVTWGCCVPFKECVRKQCLEFPCLQRSALGVAPSLLSGVPSRMPGPWGPGGPKWLGK